MIFIDQPALSRDLIPRNPERGVPDANDLDASRETRTAYGASDLPDSVFAFPKQRKEPLTDERHVRDAVARFDQVIDVSDAIVPWPSPTSRRLKKLQCRPFGDVMARTRRPSQLHREKSRQGVVTRRERGELKEAAAKAVETKRESGVLKEKAAATRKRSARTRPLSICVSCRVLIGRAPTILHDAFSRLMSDETYVERASAMAALRGVARRISDV